MKSAVPPSRQHVWALAIALTIVGAVLAAGVAYGKRIEQLYVHALAPDLSQAKVQGVALQKEAFAQPDLLVLYGSSELAKEMPNNASQFFQDYPTGFRVFPVGQPGMTSLHIAQKIAAVGESIRGKKVAFSISPGWFFTENFDPAYYAGNFSAMQASELAFTLDLSHGLKHDIARRMLDFPKTVDDEWLLDFALDRLASDSPLDRAVYALIWPLGRLGNEVGRMQDHFEVVTHILAEDAKLNQPTKRGFRALNWNDMMKRAAKFAEKVVPGKRKEVAARKVKRQRDRIVNANRTFVQAVGKAREWGDLTLLLRTFEELGAKPLLLSMPVEDIRLEVYGVTAEGRTEYHNHLAELAHRYGATLYDFHEHEHDPAFLVDFLDHLSAEGWLYYNQALDDFYHRPDP